jgi:hypothetical protein
VNDQALVRVLDRRTNLTKQFETLADGKTMRIAVLVDGLPLHQFHDQVGNAVFRGPPIQQTRYVGVIQTGENLPLVSKTLEHK